MQTREQLWICISDAENLRSSAETPGGATETVEITKSKFFMQVWGKNDCMKNELNVINNNSIRKYDVIIH